MTTPPLEDQSPENRVRFEMLDVQVQLLAEIANPRMKREDVALTYAFGLRQGSGVDWLTVNNAIIERWSMAALKWIKTYAWKAVRS